MYLSRVIPILLISDGGLVKTRKFKDQVYVGDPVNAVKIFNEKEVDELIVVDIDCSKKGSPPNYSMIEEIAGECFMPICYGGGITSIDHVKRVFSCGVEKISINSALFDTDLIRRAVDIYGSQSIVASIDVKKKSFWGGYTCCGKSSRQDFAISPLELGKKVETEGVGEILLNSIDNDGMMTGFDLELIESVSTAVSIPVIASGGAGGMADLKKALQAKASAVAAGSMFVFHGKHRAVLINYPSPSELALLGKNMGSRDEHSL
ncbi:Imidazole glycerol phosphate synthase subunit HisF [compost metagenome]